MIFRLATRVENRSFIFEKRFCSSLKLEKKKNYKPKIRAAVVRKNTRVLKTSDGKLNIKEFPLLFKLFEKNEGTSFSEKIRVSNENDLFTGASASSNKETDQKILQRNEFIAHHRKMSSIGERHRKEMRENIVLKQRMEGKLLITHSRYLLKSYLHACVNSNLVDKAHHSLIWYKHKFKPFGSFDVDNLVDVSIFNIVLKGWAVNGKIQKFEEVLRVMKYSKITPNIQSFAYHLICLLKQKEFNESSIKQVIQNMRKYNLQPERLLVESSLDKANRVFLTEGLKKIEPSLNFASHESADSYNCRLLKNFDNEPRQAHLLLNESDVFDHEKFLREQVESEINGIIKIRSVYSEAVDESENVEHYRSLWKACEESWRKSFTEAFNRNLKTMKTKFSHHYEMDILPYLSTLKTEAYVDIMLQEMSSLARISSNYSPPLFTLYEDIAKKVMNRYLTQTFRQNYPEVALLNEECVKYIQDCDLMAEVSPRKFIKKICVEKKLYLNNEISEMSWHQPTLRAVGKFLYDIILNESTIQSNVLMSKSRHKTNVPIFYQVYVSRDGRTFEELRSNVNFSKLYEMSKFNELFFNVSDLPMVVPPFPWISHNRGGFLYQKTDFIREPGIGEEGLLGIKLAANANLNAIHDALNVLSFCPWKVNCDVLDVVIQVFRSNGNMHLDIPLHQSVLPSLPKLNNAQSRAEKFALCKKRNAIKQQKSEMYSLWCDCLYKLSIANHFRDRVFWFPQNLDFRGRVYSVPPHFNHLGGDVSRSLLLFAKGKPLGPKGLDWLKIHVVNLTGLRKRSSVQERLEYANEILPLIFDSADNPLNGTKWWMDSEEPWQTLACCKEITKASRSPNPEEYICHFPVHQDGSCNGLQHYAALGRDEKGAISVNLAPSEKPNDVYSEVASQVEKLRENDSTDKAIARTLSGFINRKVIKQTVMTYVYGVTRFGAKLQILKRLKDIETFPQEHSWTASVYLTQKTFDSIQNMFTATRKIQDWFTNCARTISSVLGSPVEWQTPLGFPVVQPYFKKLNQKPDKNDVMVLKTDSSTWKPNTLKQKNAFPPNFIHSLDSSHMMLTALYCEKRGITFAAVHDSYWTHPATVDQMNKICREQFFALHSEPILEDLSNFMADKYEPLLRKMFSVSSADYKKHLSLLKAVPETGSFELRNVLHSTYFFS